MSEDSARQRLAAGKAKLEGGDFVGAIGDLVSARRSLPACSETLKYLGASLRRLGDNAGASKALNAANELLPLDAFTLHERGVVKYETTDFKGAVLDLELAKALGNASTENLSVLGSAKIRGGERSNLQVKIFRLIS